MLNDLYFKTTCNIRPHFLGPMGGLNIEGPLYYIQWSLSLRTPSEEYMYNLFRQDTDSSHQVPRVLRMRVMLPSSKKISGIRTELFGSSYGPIGGLLYVFLLSYKYV